MMPSGWDEAKAWVEANAPDWRIARGEARLEAIAVGVTVLRVEVHLAYRLYDAVVVGEGSTYLEAVQRAIGAVE